jgi:hypothetical protein
MHEPINVKRERERERERERGKMYYFSVELIWVSRFNACLKN